MNLLTVVTFLPLVGALALVLLPREEPNQHRSVTLVFTVLTFVLSLGLWFGFDASAGAPEFQFETRVPWIQSIGIGYHVGLDGVALLLVMLTTVLTPIVILSAWRAVEERVKEFMIALLVLETAMIGTFAALDLVLFYVFWELILVPMYLLIGVWGSQNRLYATVKFFIFTFAASVLMLLAILYVYFHDGGTFDYVDARAGAAGDARGGALALPRVRARVRGEGADVPAPHVAARRAHRGAHRRLGHPRRRAPQDGHVRLLPVRAAALPRGGAPVPNGHRRARGDRASSTARSCRSCRPT